MGTQTYTSRLTDLSEAPLSAWYPQLRISPEEEAFGPAGLVSERYREVPVDPGSGAFSVALIPSGELTGRSGKAGVDYIIQARLLGEHHSWLDLWRFTAVAGGGPIHEMQGGSLLAIWVGPPWPAYPLPKGFYFDTTGENPYGIVE